MNTDFLQAGIFIFVLLLLVKPFGTYMAKIFEGKPAGVNGILLRFERMIYSFCGIKYQEGMTWKTYAISVIIFNIIGLVFLYILQRVQSVLFLNPMGMASVPPDLSFNTAVSFVTNTNWQSYSGETTMGYLTQIFGLTVQNFLSAATGMAVLLAVIRGFINRQKETIGNFWVDITRTILYILLPLSICLSLVLVSQGVVQTFKPYAKAHVIQPITIHHKVIKTQIIARGPVASQTAIAQLGTNGGGFFNANASHPFANPNALSNFLEMLAILLIPASLCYTFGYMVKDKRQGWALLAAMFIIFIPSLWAVMHFEQIGNPLLNHLNVNQKMSSLQSGGNMEGKEARFGIADSAIWTVSTTAASNGSVNSMLDSYMPISGMVPMWLMQLGEVIFGGVGSGLYGMLAFVIVAVFMAGLMIGRTPEYLGKKIESYEIKMAALILLIPHLCVLIPTAIAVVLPSARQAILNPGPHGFSEILYAFTSAGNNNGSAFAGLSTNTFFYNVTLGLSMFFSRFLTIIAALAIAGSLSKKKIIPTSPGTLVTYQPVFIIFLVMIILIVGALTFFPALALGPIAEHFLIAKP